MELPLNVWMWLAAAAPIIVLLILMVKFQWGASKAAPVGLLISLVSALTLYRADWVLVAAEAGKGLWSSLMVLIVVWPAILIFEVTDKANGFNVIREGLKKFSPNELLQVLMVGWVFVSFLQGVTGFGVPIAVGAPLLVGMGVKPLWAVFIPLIGSAWANTFGTLAVAWDALVLTTDLSSNPQLLLKTALWAAIFIWVWNAISGVAIAYFYGGIKALKKGLPAIAIISLIHGGGQLLLSQVNQTLAAFIPTLTAMAVVLLLGRTKLYNKPWRVEESALMDRERIMDEKSNLPKNMSIHQAFIPYYVLTAITLVVLLFTPIKSFLSQFQIGFAFPETSTGYSYVSPSTESYSPLSPFTHASVFLLLASVIGFLYFKKKGWLKGSDAKLILKDSLAKTGPSAIAVIAFIVMSRFMGGTGQTVVLAAGIASVMGKGFSVFSPVIGMLGSFITSSNMASNILFGEFQLTTAQILQLDTAAILGAQTAGGAIGNTICPGNIILGTTTAGILGKEGIILKKILPLTVVAAVIIGLILFLATVVF